MQNQRRGHTRRLSSLISFPRPRTPLSVSASGHYNQNRRGRGAMPLHLWGVDRRDVWRTCMCLHVRTVTIFIGVWYLMLYILALSFMAALLMYEPNGVTVGGGDLPKGDEQLLPTPLSKSSDDQSSFSALTRDYRTLQEEDYSPRSKIDQIRNGPWNLVLDTRKANSQVVLLTVCNMLITLLMVYGAVRGKPSYLMPFFILKVFEFCIYCLTMVGFFSYLPNVSEIISKEPALPYKDQLLNLPPQLLSLLTLIMIIGSIAIKAYVISVIWNCYKYLMLRNTVIRGVIAYRNPDDPTNIIGIQQNLLPDLPDYDTAINDPRYAKKPPTEGVSATDSEVTNTTTTATTLMTANNNLSVVSVTPSMTLAPPPYSVAIATEPFNIVMPHEYLTAAAPAAPASASASTSVSVPNSVVEQVQVPVVVETVITDASTSSSCAVAPQVVPPLTPKDL